jgi:hypothetical protein
MAAATPKLEFRWNDKAYSDHKLIQSLKAETYRLTDGSTVHYLVRVENGEDVAYEVVERNFAPPTVKRLGPVFDLIRALNAAPKTPPGITVKKWRSTAKGLSPARFQAWVNKWNRSEVRSARLRTLAQETSKWLQERQKHFSVLTDEKMNLLNDAFYQLSNDKQFDDSDGYQTNDIRHPSNPFNGYTLQDLIDFCHHHKIVTRYTPLEDIDIEFYARQLILLYCTGNDTQQTNSRTELTTLPQKRLTKQTQHIIHELTR